VTEREFRGRPGRLDAVVAELSGLTRADVQRAIADGLVSVDGLLRPKSYRLAGGEHIVADLETEAPLEPEGPPVPIRFQDEHMLVISKPAGVVTHPTRSRKAGTLVNRLLGMGLDLSSVGGPLRPGIVHRLDAGTSGLMIVAKTDDAHQALADAFRRHEILRAYLALVRGEVEPDRFTVEAPLGRRAARVVVDRTGGKGALTHFEVADRLTRCTLLKASPSTGRTHQIRVHLAAVGHPILGDRAYGGGGDDATRLGLTRPFLHSWRLSLRHPITGDRIELEDALPNDLRRALVAAGANRR
jgi:23S rRNA pseudouridine1911/1915/1917 synthase